MRPPLRSDTATRHRAAAAFALGFAAAAITALGGVLALDVAGRRLAPVFALDLLPDSTWLAPWLPGAISAAQQQRAAADQWLHVILVFGAITVAIACVNALIGLWSHGNERRYETAVRGIVGASVRQLKRALLRNALANAAIGAGVGVPAGLVTALVSRRMWADSEIVYTTPSAWVLLAVSVCLALATVAARITGSRLARRGWLGDAIAPAARTAPGWGAEALRALLTTAQLACAVALTTVSLLVWSYANTQRTQGTAGTARSYVSVARVSLPAALSPAERQRAYERILTSIAAASVVESESIATPGALLGVGKVDKVISECGRCARAGMIMPMFPVAAQHHVVSPGFFRTAGIKLTGGREFDARSADGRGVVVNDTFARVAFQGQDPIGKVIRIGGFDGERYQVIGTVAPVRTTGLQYLEPDPANLDAAQDPALPPAIYFSTAAFTPATFDAVARTRGPALAIAGFDFQPLVRMLERAQDPGNAFARVLALLGLLLCGAAAIGTFVTTLLNVKSRRTEIAMRRALGARRRDVWRLVYGALIRNALYGALIGAALAGALSRILELFVPGLPAVNLMISAGVGSAFVAVALAAALLPVLEALRISPALVQADS